VTPSFERLDYLLRTNKNIERKLIFDVLLHARQSIEFPEPTYLGFGSMWFGDFHLAHRILGLEKMVSIEREDHSPRAEFNKPYASVSIRAGECLSVMRNFTADDWKSPLFAWFDFDGILNADVAEAIEIFLSNCAENSVLVITVNAVRSRYAKGTIREKRDETSVAYVEQILGSASVDPKFYPQSTGGGQFQDVDAIVFRELLADALLAFMKNKMRLLAREKDHKSLSFVPLFNLCHADGAAMVTVGGAVAIESDVRVWRRCLSDHPVLPSADDSPVFHTLDLIPITLREKLALDSCLPESEEGYLNRARKCGLQLPKEEIEKYRRFNRHFPVFVESPI
jgi:hypothetical protein